MTDSKTLWKKKNKNRSLGRVWYFIMGMSSCFFFFYSFLLSGCWCGSLSICSGNCDVCSWAGSEVLEPFSKRARESTLQHLVIERLACGAELVRMRQVPMGSRLLLVLSFILVWGSAVQGKTLPPPRVLCCENFSICMRGCLHWQVRIWESWTP